MPCPFFAHGGVAFDGDCGAALQILFEGRPRPSGALRHPSPHRPPDPRRARKPTSGAVVPLNRVRTGGGRGASVPRPPGAGVPGWFGPGRRLGPPVALRHQGGPLVSARRGGANGRLPGEERRRRPRPMPVRCTEPSGGTGGGWWTASWRCESLMRICPSRWSELPTRSRVPSSLESMCSAEASLPVVLIPCPRLHQNRQHRHSEQLRARLQIEEREGQDG